MTDGLAASQGAVAYSYDNFGRLNSRSRTPAGGASTGFAYGYDGFGRLASRSYPDGTVIAYSFNDADQITQEAWAAPGSPGVPGNPYGSSAVNVSYSYDPSGHLTGQATPNSVSVSDTYDNAGRLTTSLAKRGNATVSKFDQSLDKVGNPTVITTRRGTAISKASYAYDQDNRLTQVCYASPCLTGTSPSPSISYSYDSNDNRTSETRVGVANPGTRKSNYNDLDQLIQTTDANGNALVNYGYDLDGHQNSATATTAGAASGVGIPNATGSATVAGTTNSTYNLADQLVTLSATSTSGTPAAVGFTYDGDNNRSTKTFNGSSVANYAWDVRDAFPQLALETDASAALQRRYIVGVGGQLGQSTASADSVDLWLFEDLQNNVTDILDNSGQTAWSGSYEPYGSLLSSTPTTSSVGQSAASNPLGFDSEYSDQSIGLVNDRARQYDTLSGRFTSLDPVPGKRSEAFSSAYQYVASRPTVLHDPSGEIHLDFGGEGGDGAVGQTYGEEASNAELPSKGDAEAPDDATFTEPISPNDAREAQKAALVDIKELTDDKIERNKTDQNQRCSTDGNILFAREPLSVDSSQFGKKWGRHAEDYGYEPSDAAGREWYRNRIQEVYYNPDEIRQGDYYVGAGGGHDYVFSRQGFDVVITKPTGAFVTMFPGTGTEWYLNATVVWK